MIDLSFVSHLGGLQLALLDSDTTGMMPAQGSTVAPMVDGLFGFIWWLSWFFFVLIIGLLAYFGWKYRARAGHKEEHSSTHNTPLELLWSGIPLILVIYMFWVTYRGYLDLRQEPLNAYEVQVTGQKWNWTFQYPNGLVDPDLHVPAGQPVKLIMTSVDVIHSMFIPDFRVKQDVVPGRYTKLWFEAVNVEDYPKDKKFPDTQRHQIFCTEYCGKGHSDMLAGAYVHPDQASFDAWLAYASDLGKRFPNPADAGKYLYDTRGCAQCHSVDGKTNTGPTFKGLWGHEVKLADGSTVTVDENYVRQSILDPQSQVVSGFQPVMPTFQGRLSDEYIGYLIAYIKSLK